LPTMAPVLESTCEHAQSVNARAVVLGPLFLSPDSIYHSPFLLLCSDDGMGGGSIITKNVLANFCRVSASVRTC
jgi:hypothetical protein